MSLLARLGGTSNGSSNGDQQNQRPRGQGRSASGQQQGKHQRAAAAAPYAKTPPATSGGKRPAPIATAGASGDVEGKWEHDLFSPLSDLYSPTLNSAALHQRKPQQQQGLFGKALGGIAAPSASLRPFGTATPPPLVSPPLEASTSSARGQNEQYAANDLFGRLGIQGIKAGSSSSNGGAQTSVSAAEERRLRQRQVAEMEQAAVRKEADKKAARAREEEERKRLELLRLAEMEQLQSRREEEEAAARAKAATEAKRQQQARQPRSTFVEVKNLVDGTTPEDVKAAFADYGTILGAKVLASNGETLTMEVEFEQRAHADAAIAQLNGALADGLTLELTIVERPIKGIGMGLSVKGTKNRQVNGHQNNNSQPQQQQRGMQGVPTGPRSAQSRAGQQQQGGNRQQRQPEPEPVRSPDNMAMDIPQQSSRMRSEAIAQYDPRATILTSPEKQPRPVRNDRSASSRGNYHNNNNSSRGGGNSNGSSLLSRLGQSRNGGGDDMALD